MCAKISGGIPTRIVCCSEASREVHADYGYKIDKMVVIPNGFDLHAFKPDDNCHENVRRELGLKSSSLIIGNVARYDPQKDHVNLIRAAQIVHRKYRHVNFVLCGDGISWDNNELVKNIKAFGLEEIFHLLGRRDDVPRLTAAFDIACLSSAYGEGFPNVIGEAMACEVPCVVTDVGDSALIVGNTGIVVSPRDPDGLAQALLDMISMGADKRRELGRKARQRVYRYYNLPDIVRQHEDLYKETILRISDSGKRRAIH